MFENMKFKISEVVYHRASGNRYVVVQRLLLDAPTPVEVYLVSDDNVTKFVNVVELMSETEAESFVNEDPEDRNKEQESVS